jgi:hypothetical protein
MKEKRDINLHINKKFKIKEQIRHCWACKVKSAHLAYFVKAHMTRLLFFFLYLGRTTCCPSNFFLKKPPNVSSIMSRFRPLWWSKN